MQSWCISCHGLLCTLQGQKIQGPAAITQKLTSLPFQQCQHRISSLDGQPSLSQGILIFVTGQIMVRIVLHSVSLMPLPSPHAC